MQIGARPAQQRGEAQQQSQTEKTTPYRLAMLLEYRQRQSAAMCANQRGDIALVLLRATRKICMLDNISTVPVEPAARNRPPALV